MTFNDNERAIARKNARLMHHAAIPYNKDMAQRQKRRVLWRRWGSIFLVAAILFVLTPLIGGLLLPWSRLNNRSQLIDINSGRMRQTRSIYFITVHDKSEATAFSDVLDVDHALIPDWRTVNTFSPGTRHSPHYRFHGALSQTREVELLWLIADFTPEAKTRITQDIVSLWKQDQSYHLASQYLRQLEKLERSVESSQTITVDDIAAIEIEGG